MANLRSLNCRFLKEGKLCELEGRIIPVYESGQVMVSESCSIDAKVSVYTINYCLLTIYFFPLQQVMMANHLYTDHTDHYLRFLLLFSPSEAF